MVHLLIYCIDEVHRCCMLHGRLRANQNWCCCPNTEKRRNIWTVILHKAKTSYLQNYGMDTIYLDLFSRWKSITDRPMSVRRRCLSEPTKCQYWKNGICFSSNFIFLSQWKQAISFTAVKSQIWTLIAGDFMHVETAALLCETTSCLTINSAIKTCVLREHRLQ